MIRLEAIELSLGSQERKVNVLRGLDLTVPAGETIAVEGPSGSGKTSMLMVIAGLERPTRGRVQVDGVELGALNEDALARFRRDRVGIVFQGFHLIATMTALENVAVPLELAGRPDAFVRAREELTAVGLAARLSHYPGELSGGEQQRVALARAFAGEPQLLLADEPSGNLDPDTGHAVMDLMFAEVTRRGTTLLLITHDPALALRCRRRLRLVEGRLIDEQTAEGIAAHG
jgi:putative ABC transport system ATP-binding protein